VGKRGTELSQTIHADENWSHYDNQKKKQERKLETALRGEKGPRLKKQPNVEGQASMGYAQFTYYLSPNKKVKGGCPTMTKKK